MLLALGDRCRGTDRPRERLYGLNMLWRRKEEKSIFAALYERLVDGAGDRIEVKKGHVPVLVGDKGDDQLERFVVPMKTLQDPCMATLLEMGAQEFGYRQKGILRIPCTADHFRQVLGVITKSSI